MKTVMKVLLKKDIKALLPSFAMLVMAGFALCVMCLFGIFTGNGNFAVTAIYVFFIALIPAFAYTVLKGANLYRMNLSDTVYLSSIKDKGVTVKSFILGKQLWTWILGAIIATEYLIGSLVATALAFKMLPSGNGNDQGFAPEFKDALGGMGAIDMILSYPAVLFITAGVTSVAYLAFELCFVYFIRGRYALIASLMTFFSMFWVVWKIYDFVVPVSGVMSIMGTAIYGAVICTICTLLHLKTASKKIFKDL